MTTRVLVLVPEHGAFKVEAVTQQLRRGGNAEIDPDYWEDVDVIPLGHRTFHAIYLHDSQRLVVRELPLKIDFPEDQR